MADTTQHIAVMVDEAIRALQPKAGGCYIDGTLGGATHTEEILKASAPDGRVLSLDVDTAALKRADQRLKGYGARSKRVESNFRRLDEIAEREGFASCDGILLDLGFSSDELADPEYGLSFQTDGPLDMRFGAASNEDGLTAAEIVNRWTRDELEELIREYGEERAARKIAEVIVLRRKAQPFERTLDLANTIKAALPAMYERGRIHPATRTFQALRIAVNDEFGALRDAIVAARHTLKDGGRLAIITFHSLEDRIVKIAFKEADDLMVITKKPLVPTDEEQTSNPRSRSAKLRVAEKVQTKQTPNKKYVSHARTRYDETP
ncbi:MAG: 16S rRNA (cytosine(1402)-N(4))-methyltransferase RsmH [Patescibacteria group bacterium]